MPVLFQYGFEKHTTHDNIKPKNTPEMNQRKPEIGLIKRNEVKVVLVHPVVLLAEGRQ